MEGGLVVNISGGSWLKLNIYKLRNLKFLTSTEWSYLFCNTSSLCSKVLFVKKRFFLFNTDDTQNATQ